MFKQVEKTPTIKDWIAQAYGDPKVDTSDLAVFEAAAANTRPLLRRYGLHAGAVMQPDVLHHMADAVNGGATVPLHVMHQTHNTPVGRVFRAQVRPGTDGGPQLHAMFYMSHKDADLVDKVNKGILNEVSVGVSPKEVRCSACGWDYRGKDATIDNLLDCTCPNGHTIGEDGVHAKLHGLLDWQELSLVDRGAMKGSLILPKSRQAMAATPDFERLAASGFEPSWLRLSAICDFTPPPPAPGNPAMSDEMIDLKASHIVLTRDHEAAKTELVALRAKVAELETQLGEALKGDAVALKAQLADVEAFVNEYATAALAAIGKDATALPAAMAERIAAIKEARAQLALSLVPGGVALGATRSDDPKPAGKPNFSAFVTPR